MSDDSGSEDEDDGRSSRRQNRRSDVKSDRKHLRRKSTRRGQRLQEAEDHLREFWLIIIRLADRLGRRLGRPVPELLIYTDTEEVLDRIDEKSRRYFPLSFGIIMVAYWMAYLYIMQDEVFV